MKKQLMFAGAAILLGLLAKQGCNYQPALAKVEQAMNQGDLSGVLNGVLQGQQNPNPQTGGVQQAGYTGNQYPTSGVGQQTTGQYNPTQYTGTNNPPVSPATQANPSGTILIGSFNIQVFGRSKLSSPDVSGILIDIAGRFDVLAIQELRSTEQDIIPWFVQHLNSRGHNFQYIVGPRQGYTVSKEQYVFLFNTNRIRTIAEPFIAQDPLDKIHRSPMVTRFQTTELPSNEAFTFALMNIHTDPDLVPQELSRLEQVIPMVQQTYPDEDDLILLGDLNAWPEVMSGYKLLPRQGFLIPDAWATNTRKDRTYDNIVIDSANTTEFTGQRGVVDLEKLYGLSLDQALEVSDHLPVWGQFSIREQRTATAQLPAAPVGWNGQSQ